MITYDLSQHTAGDTWNGIPSITITRNGSPLDLTGATAEIHVKFQIDAPTVAFFTTEDGSSLDGNGANTLSLNYLSGVYVNTPNNIFSGSISTKAPITISSSYSVKQNDSSLIFNGACTLTLPNVSNYSGRWLYLKLIAAASVVSASSNVVQLSNSNPSTAIFSAAAAGKYSWLQSDGVNWIIMAQN